MSRHSSAVNFQAEVSADDSLKLRHEFEHSGIVTRIFAVSVLGEEGDVERHFELIKNGTDTMNLLEAATTGSDQAEEFVAGDDVRWDMPVSEEFSPGDVLQMRVVNQDGSNPYPNNAWVSVRFGSDPVTDLLRGVGF